MRQDEMGITVVGYSGYAADERPLYFVVDQKRVKVKRLLNRWRDQAHDIFRVLAEDGRVYVLKRHRSLDQWSLFPEP